METGKQVSVVTSWCERSFNEQTNLKLLSLSDFDF